MLINRDNYENYFLLYVDGELCAADQKTVEDFATSNTDLQYELKMLKETVLRADETEFIEKSFLYKTADIDELLQERLLLKMDNELPENEYAGLELLLATDPAVSKEYRSLKQAQLEADEQIIFPGKEVLYRREKEPVVIGGFFWRATAAVLIGIGLFFGISYLRHDKTVGSIATTITPAPVKTLVPAPSQQNTDQNNTLKNIASVKTVPKAAKTSSHMPAQVILPGNISAAAEKKNNSENDIIKKEDRSNDGIAQHDIPVLQKKNENNLPEPIRINNEPTQGIVKVIPPKKTEAPVDQNIVPLENTYVLAASLPENARSENKVLYMNEDDLRRSKAGGLFRKMKRFVERNAKLKTGDFRVAGFQLAAK